MFSQSNFPNSYPQQLVDGPITIYSNGGADDTLMAPNVHAGDCEYNKKKKESFNKSALTNVSSTSLSESVFWD